MHGAAQEAKTVLVWGRPGALSELPNERGLGGILYFIYLTKRILGVSNRLVSNFFLNAMCTSDAVTSGIYRSPHINRPGVTRYLPVLKSRRGLPSLIK
ncbi:BQ5605_C018g08659 [Microbotryum silenes-dioicae]|uniref:BQ5605_C018g08659 protein n=1 Tax=Microbotryum silenes-dioicae TaxID=796604 RepID=A0A2X0M0M2_9BASI|nr:BQ5605_C018g08659 [Microbotryum silenes-dioicae]